MGGPPESSLVNDFSEGRLGILVTRYEHRSFMKFYFDNYGPPTPRCVVEMPRPMTDGFACVYYRTHHGCKRSFLTCKCFSVDKIKPELRIVLYSTMANDPKRSYYDAKVALGGVVATMKSALHRVEVTQSHLEALGKTLGYKED